MAHVLAVAAGLLVQEELVQEELLVKEELVQVGVRGRGAGNRSRGGRAWAVSTTLEHTTGRTNCVFSKGTCTSPGHTSNGSLRSLRQGKMRLVLSACNARTSL